MPSGINKLRYHANSVSNTDAVVGSLQHSPLLRIDYFKLKHYFLECIERCPEYGKLPRGSEYKYVVTMETFFCFYLDTPSFIPAVHKGT